MAGEDNLQMADLPRPLAWTIDDADMRRSWTKVKGGPKKAKRPTDGIAALAPRSRSVRAHSTTRLPPCSS